MRNWIALLGLALCATTIHAAPPKPDAPPPTIADQGQAETEPEPEVRTVQKGDVTHEEYRVNGRLYMIKVIPKIGPPYYLVDKEGTGEMTEVDPSTRVVIPQWVLVRF